MEKVKEYFSKGFYSNVWDDICSAHHGTVQDDLDGSGDQTLVRLNPYHHESVYDHVHMVYEESLKSGDDRIALLASVHDIAKAYCRFYNENNGRVRFAGHEYASALFSINFLRQFVPEEELISYLKVLTLHVVSYGENPHNYDLNETELELLKGLNIADNAGRICEDRNDLPFDEWVPVEENTKVFGDAPEYTILVGIPGSGKSHYTNGGYMGKVFSTDDYMEKTAEIMFGVKDDYNLAFQKMSGAKINWVGQTIDNSLYHLKETGEDCLLDATNLTKKKRSNIAKRARKLGAHVKYVMVWRDFSECVGCRSSGEKNIPEGVFKRMFTSFTYPKKSEYDTIEHVVV